MRSLFTTTLALLVITGLATAQDGGDVVSLKNGDRLTGTVKAVTSDGVVIETSATGEVTIALDEIQDLRTRGPIDISTDSGDRFSAPVQGFSDGKLRVGTGAEVRDLAAADLVEYRPPVQWTGSLNAGGSISTGNTERRTANAAAEAIRRTDDTRLTMRGSWDYGEDKQDTSVPPDGKLDTFVLSQRRTYGSVKFDYFLTDALYAYGAASGENDEFASLKLRATYGAGLGYQFFDENSFSLSGEAGVSYVDEKRYPPGEDNGYLAARLAYALRWDITDDTQLLQNVEAYPSLEDGDDFYSRADTRLRTSLTEAMFAQLQWVFDYDNTPAPGKDRQDHRLILGVGWSF